MILRSRGRLLGVLLFLLMAAAAAGSASTVRAQAEPFAVDAVSARLPDAAPSDPVRLDVYARVPHASLRFLNDGGQYRARYELSAEAYRLDEDGDRQGLAARTAWTQAVTASTYEAARAADRFDASTQPLRLAPGRYALDVRLRDAATDAPLARSLQVRVRALGSPVAVSDLIVLERYDEAAGTITPRVASVVGTEEDALRVFYELYADRARRVRVTKELVRTRTGGGLPVIGTLFGLGESEEEGTVTYTQADAMRLEPGRTPTVVAVPMRGAEAGTYVLRVRVEDEQGRALSEAEKRVTVRWTGLLAHVRDVDAAVAQLGYIAKGKDLDYIQAGRTEAERLERFRAFWKKRDPTPGTERNERMEEYYYRVARANRSYEEDRAGWRTDRGHVLVLFGAPDAIERQPRSADAEPYEVWRYDQIGRRFIFVREGSGAFKLLEPIWDDSSLR